METHAGTYDGISYRYKGGNGVPIVFAHGWLGSKDSWNDVVTAAELDNPMLFYDQRCHGESSCKSFDFEDLAADLAHLIDHCGIEYPVIAGHSLGGMVALTYATRYDNLLGLFLAGTCASTPVPRLKSPQFFLDQLGTMDRQDWAELIVQNYAPKDSALAQLLTAELVEADEEPLRYGLDSMVSYDIRDNLTERELPGIVIAGERDQAITLEKSKELADLLRCPLIRLDASHLLLHETAEAVADALTRFVNNHN